MTNPSEYLWKYYIRNLSREHGYEKLEIEGRIPSQLNGTLFRNGPGILDLFERRYKHWFDGDGAISAVRIRNGEAFGAAKIIQTEQLQKERRAGRYLYDGYSEKNASLLRRFGMFFGKDAVKNTANTSVMFWQGKLLALMEAKLPVQIHPDDLSTLGETRLNGLLNRAFSAHPHSVPSRNACYNFSVLMGAKCQLEIYELPDVGAGKTLGRFDLSWTGMVHDFIATENYLIFFCPPLKLKLSDYVFSKKGYDECMEWTPSLGTEVLVIPIDEPSKFIRFQTEPFFQWHFANAFEKGGDIIVDFVRYSDFKINRWLSEVLRGPTSNDFDGRFCRAVLNRSTRKISYEILSDDPCDFPTVRPTNLTQSYEEVFLSGFSSQASRRGPGDTIARLDLQTGTFKKLSLPKGHFPSETVYAQGYLLSIINDAESRRSYLGIANPDDLDAGLIAKAWFNHGLPGTFHGIFVPENKFS